MVAYGTRPEWIKLKGIIEILKSDPDTTMRPVVLYTGQQTEIGEFEWDRTIEIQSSGDNRLNGIISKIVSSDVFDGITHVIVQGDTASSFAVALAAFNRGIKVSHVEAGLRTYDKANPFPEDSYRKMISAIADYHFCPRIQDSTNLMCEGVPSDKIWVTGNTVIDTLPKLNVSYEDMVLVTMHRRENLPKIREWFRAIESLAEMNPQTEFILPRHPNPVIAEAGSEIFKAVKWVPPMSHSNFVRLLSSCKCVITDSGGIQEESAFYKKKVLVCRKVTERPSSNQIMVREPKDLQGLYDVIIRNPQQINHNPFNDFGDGHSSETIVSILKRLQKSN
jgi:UDP-N-acetylglucosamine 2-epimerase (non-hydrolysing)